MIEHDSVLVVGAGASHPYGFPTGERLRSEIIDLVERSCKSNPNKSEIHKLVERNSDPRLLRTFAHDFKRSPRESIDIFIGARPELADVGKLAIASILCSHEIEGALCGNDGIRKEDWLRVLFNDYLVPSVEKEEFGENRLKIITFNYDRSIEHRFATDLLRTFGGTKEDARELARKIEVIHVHGHLGSYFGDEAGSEAPFIESFDEKRILNAANSLSYFFEHRDDSKLENIRAVIANACRVAFIGFGYDSVNLDRLIFPKRERAFPEFDQDMAAASRNKFNASRIWKAEQISGTTFGLASVRKEIARERIESVARTKVAFEDLKCRQFLENRRVFI